MHFLFVALVVLALGINKGAADRTHPIPHLAG